MSILGVVILLAVLTIPVLAVLFDSPVGRALARRVEGPQAPAADIGELAKKVDLLEGEVDDLHRAVEQLQEENQFLQRLIEESPPRPGLPPRTGD